MGTMNFRQLEVWAVAHRLVLKVYKLTQQYPKHELNGLTSQMRRCSAAIASNIAEGCGRSGNGDLRKSLDMAMGSTFELEYFLLLSRDLGLLGDSYDEFSFTTRHIQRMLASLI